MQPPQQGESTAPADVDAAILNQDVPMKTYCISVFLNDGIALARAYAGPSDIIWTVDCYNLLPLALGLPHPKGDASWFTYNRTVSERSYPPPQRVLHDVTLVMQPKRFIVHNTGDFLLKVYGPRIRAEFRPIAESKFWILWRRQSPAVRS